MSGQTFISNIGGLLGMWLGLSALSIVDLVEKGLAFYLNKKNECENV